MSGEAESSESENKRGHFNVMIFRSAIPLEKFHFQGLFPL